MAYIYMQVKHGLYKFNKNTKHLFQLLKMAFYAIHIIYQHT